MAIVGSFGISGIIRGNVPERAPLEVAGKNFEKFVECRAARSTLS
jgi:hypothetical protein